MMRWSWFRACGALLCAASCASRAPAPTTLRVELLRDASVPVEVTRPRVELLIDATASMAGHTSEGIELLAAGRHGALRLLRSLPEDAGIATVYAVGGPASACEHPTITSLAGEGVARAEQQSRLEPIRPHGEASLADALQARLDAHEEGQRALRIAVFTDLAPDCGSDWCALASAFARRGVRLDLVVIGNAEVPACLIGALVSDSEAWVHEVPARVAFQVESRSAADIPRVVRGVADGPAVTLAPGRGTLVLELDPPLRVDRDFPAGVDLVLQVLDFPNRLPSVRRWRWVAASGVAEQDPMHR